MSEAESGAGEGRREGREELVRRLERLEAELAQAGAALVALGPERLPGLHLAVEVAGHRALLPASRVCEVLRLVATRPVPGAPPEVLGTFALRGGPVTVLDLARCLGTTREPELDAVIVVLAGARPVGLLVDRVLAVEERAELLQGAPETGGAGPWSGARLSAGLCRWRDELLPLLDVAPLVRRVEDAPA